MKTRRTTLALFLVGLFLIASEYPPITSSQTPSGSNGLNGFTVSGGIAQRRLEEQFRAIPAANSAREHLRRLTAEPHVAGTKEDYATAIYVRDQIRSYGIPAELKEYDVLLPYPKLPSVVEILLPRREKLPLKEAVIPEDPTAANPRIIPLFNGYSPSGDVTASLVYVNYGLPPDYEALKKNGVSVKGKIVLARYGNSFRGVKAKVAEENGAVGVLIYSDPADDGYMQGDVYPKGPWRPASSAQRGIGTVSISVSRRSVNAWQAFHTRSRATKDGRGDRLTAHSGATHLIWRCAATPGALARTVAPPRVSGWASFRLSRGWNRRCASSFENRHGLPSPEDLECDCSHRRQR